MSILFYPWLEKLKNGEALDNEDMIEVLEKMQRMDKAIDDLFSAVFDKPESVDYSSIPNPLENEFQWP